MNRKWTVGILAFQSFLILIFAGGYFKLAADNGDQNDEITTTVARGRQVINCLTTYATQLQVALEDRDTVNATTRAATKEWVAQVRNLVSAGTQDPARFFDITDVYLAALDRLDHNVTLNPYPKIKPCLRRIDGDSEQERAMLRLVSYLDPGMPGPWDNKCLHRKVTIRGNDGDNNISGTNGRDVIFAYSGNDVVDAGPGRDRICGRFGADTLTGGTGFDRINGGNGGGIDLCFAERTKKCP